MITEYDSDVVNGGQTSPIAPQRAAATPTEIRGQVTPQAPQGKPSSTAAPAVDKK